MKRITVILFLLTASCWLPLQAQEVKFGQYYNFSAAAGELNPGDDLSFGLVIKNEGQVSRSISEAKVITITGFKFLDVLVDISGDPYLLLNSGCATDPSCRMPFTLQAAYANMGANDVGEARIITVSGNSATARFPILHRQSGPPGPPPTPQTEDFNPAAFEDTAYLYLYGSIDVGNIDSGTYNAQITVTVVYD